jgi:hypothetical protein
MKNRNNINFKLYKHAPKSKAAGHNIYSLRDKTKVIDHIDSIHLKNCTFYVNERGRQRVLESGVKNVHAYINAESYDLLEHDYLRLKRVIYNPFENCSFIVEVRSGVFEPIFSVEDVFCMKNGIFV